MQGQCTVQDCRRPLYAIGLCSGHYQRHRRGMPLDSPLAPRKPPAEPPFVHADLEGATHWVRLLDAVPAVELSGPRWVQRVAWKSWVPAEETALVLLDRWGLPAQVVSRPEDKDRFNVRAVPQ